jgi:hypothetical protein
MVIFSSAGQISKWTAAAAEGMGNCVSHTTPLYPVEMAEKNKQRSRHVNEKFKTPSHTQHTPIKERERDI